MNKIRILALISNSGSKYHRVLLPLDLLPKDKYEVTYLNEKFFLEHIVKDYDYIYIHWIQQTNPVFLSIWKEKYGFKIIQDIDDYWVLPFNHYMYSKIDAAKKQLFDQLILADVVLCSTPYLLNKCLEFNDNCHLRENYIPIGYQQFQPEYIPVQNRKPTIGICGSMCYDKFTEVLTKNGFKFFKDITEIDEIATLNPDTNYIEYYKPIKIIKSAYDGEMILGNNRGIDFKVTPNHKMYASVSKTLKNKKLDFKLIEIKKLKNDNFYIKQDAQWHGIKKDSFIIPSVIHNWTVYNKPRFKIYPSKEVNMEKWLKFFGFWIAEGWTTATGKLTQVGISQKKDNGILEEMYNILKEFGYNPTYTKDKQQIRVFDRGLWTYLKQFGKAKDKYIPKDILELSSEQLDILFQYYIIGDGHTEKSGRIRAHTCSKKLVDNLQEIALKTNRYSTYFERPFKIAQCKKCKNKYITPKSIQYSIGFSYKNTKKHTRLIKNQINTEHYKDYIYCVEIPNHIIYVRRNGKVMWCGNSHYDDWMSIRNQLKRIQSLKNEFDFVIAGYADENSTSRKKWNKIVNLFPNPKVFRHLPVNQYINFYKHIDILLAPLEINEFNKAKSNLKILESSVKSTITISNNLYKEKGIEDYLSTKDKSYFEHISSLRDLEYLNYLKKQFQNSLIEKNKELQTNNQLNKFLI